MSSAYPFDLGSFTRSASASSHEAQLWIDRGLVWSYAFNHEEAIRCFEQAIAADGRSALAHWGLAYAAGPNYNKPWEAFDAVDLRTSLRRAYDATQRAVDLASAAPEVERDLVEALRKRYPSPDPVDDLDRWTADYAKAMSEVHASHPGDLDVAALCADALMNVTPGRCGTSPPAGQPTVRTHSRPSGCSSPRSAGPVA